MAPNICARVGAVVSVMSKLVYPREPILDKYPNRPNNRKLEGVVLVEEELKVMRKSADAIPFFVFTNANFLDKQFYATKKYIHVTQEGTEESLFFLAEAPIPAAGKGGICALSVDRKDHTDGAEANDAPNLLSGCTSNLRSEDMAEICHQWIAIDDDNNPEMENVPRQGETTAGTGNCRI